MYIYIYPQYPHTPTPAAVQLRDGQLREGRDAQPQHGDDPKHAAVVHRLTTSCYPRVSRKLCLFLVYLVLCYC